MIRKHELHETIRTLEHRNRELESELARIRRKPSIEPGEKSRERLREAINTDREFVMVRNDDVFDVLWSNSQMKAKLAELTPARRR